MSLTTHFSAKLSLNSYLSLQQWPNYMYQTSTSKHRAVTIQNQSLTLTVLTDQKVLLCCKLSTTLEIRNTYHLRDNWFNQPRLSTGQSWNQGPSPASLIFNPLESLQNSREWWVRGWDGVTHRKMLGRKTQRHILLDISDGHSRSCKVIMCFHLSETSYKNLGWLGIFPRLTHRFSPNKELLLHPLPSHPVFYFKFDFYSSFGLSQETA